MNYQILCEPSYSLLEVELEANEKIVAEAGAMSWMTSNISTETSSRGGLMSGLKRAVLTGESFFQNTYRAENETGSIGIAPGTAGDIVAHELDGELFLEGGAFLASTLDVECNSKYQGLKGLLGEGMFVLHVSGTGTLFFNAYGDIEEVQVDGSYIVDNGFAVAWDPSLQYHLTRSKKIRSFLFSDQLLMNFTGQGRLWIQSRSPRTLANWVHPFRPVESKSD